MSSRTHNRSTRTGEIYTRVFPGNTEDKRAARLFVYKHGKAAPRIGALVALAGRDPLPEISLARDYLRWPAERAWFVDWARSSADRDDVRAGLRMAREVWPGVHAVERDINDVVVSLPVIAFAFLDFMGFNRDSVQPCIRKTMARLPIGGVLAVTFLRGREMDRPSRSAWDILNAARDVEDGDTQRHVGVQRLLDRWAAAIDIRLEFLGGVDYQNNHAPMCVMVWRRA